nr:reverse transcriptase domain-containing protein [Tanacetum cinerariifolium]
MTLRVNKEAITFKVKHTLRYSRNYYDETVHQVNVIDVAYEEYAQEVLKFLNSSTSGNPTPSDPIIAYSFPSFTPFEGSDFILEEIETFLRTSDELFNLDDYYYDMEGDILYLKKLLNEDPSLNLPPIKNGDLKQVDATMTKLSIKEPPELELKDLPSHLEYAFLEGTDKLPVIISKELKDEEKSALLKMDFLDTFRFRLTYKTKKRLPSLALMEHLPTDVCLLVYEMLQPRSKVILKYGVTHRISTMYLPQTSGQVEVSNHGLKQILERTIGENRASWSDKLDDALWAFRTTYKTPIGCTLYKLVYGKACHLPIELEHKAYWALKHCNFDLKTTGDHWKDQLNELNELRDQAYENLLIYKEKTRKIHDSKIKNRVFNIGDRVLSLILY